MAEETPTELALTVCEELLQQYREKIEHLKREIHFKNETLHEKNLALDALHYVWCNGHCPGGVHRYTDETFTEEVVLQAEYQAKRLRSKYNTMVWAIENWPKGPGFSDWHKQHIERLKRKLGYYQEREKDE